MPRSRFFSIQSQISEPRKKKYRVYFISGNVLGVIASVGLVFVFSFVRAQNAAVPSSDGGAPQISVLSREAAGKGQFLTIEGSHFGSTPGTVTFIAKGEAIIADTSFQSECEKLWWRDTYIVVKVPQNTTLQQYKIKIKRLDGVISNEKAFVVTNASPTPGICGVLPDNGPAGIPIKVYGEHFGREKGRVSIGGLVNVDMKDDAWGDTVLSMNIPAGDLGNGRLRVVSASRTLSNQVPYTAGRCTQKSCGTASECCGDGSCRPQGMCERKVYACTYAWTFSTGNLGQSLGGACVKGEDCASGVCGPDKKCIRGEKKEGETCTIDGQCREGLLCEKGICRAVLKKNGDRCSISSECLSGVCESGQCQKGNKLFGDTCVRAEECTSGNCYKGICSQPISCLKILSIEPSGTAAARNSPFIVTFNQRIDETTTKGAVSIQPPIQGIVTARIVGSGNTQMSQVVFSPLNLLTIGKAYSVKVTDSVKAFGSENTLGRCVISPEGDICSRPNNTCSVSGECLPQCPIGDPPTCISGEKVCRDKATGGLYCRRECKQGDQQVCSSSTSCVASDSCVTCAACSSELRCKQQACASPNSLCLSGKCLLQCGPNDPPLCRLDQKTCQDTTTKNFFCAASCPGGTNEICLGPKTKCSSGQCLSQCPIGDPPQCRFDQVVCKDSTTGATFCSASPCPAGSTQACSSTITCSVSDSCSDCVACSNTARCKQNTIPPPPPLTCGNNIKEGTEQCDDGDTNNENACRNNCTLQKTLTSVKILVDGKELSNQNTVSTFDCLKGQTCSAGTFSLHTYTIAVQGKTFNGAEVVLTPTSIMWRLDGNTIELTKGTPTSPSVDISAIAAGTASLTATVKDDTGTQKEASLTLTSSISPSNEGFPLSSAKVFIDGAEKISDIFSCLKGKPCATGSQILHSYSVKVFGKNTSGQEKEITAKKIQWAFTGIVKAESDISGEKVSTAKLYAENYGSGSVSVTIDQTITIPISILACANMWTYANSDYDFDMSYCADEGGQKLPLLQKFPTPQSGIQRYNDPYEREYIFQFDPTTGQDDKTKTDVIAIRVAKNTKHIPVAGDLAYAPSLNIWYTEKIGGVLSESSIVDGFRALKESIGTYVNIYVPSKNDFYVFYITANASASPETLQVLKQLTTRIFFTVFNATERSEIRRDTQRLDDLGQIAKRLDEYYRDVTSYPKLLAGSYLSGQTTSLWPSWQQTFGGDLKATLPLDPIKIQCKAVSGTPLYDLNTCWDNTNKRFFTDSVSSGGGRDVIEVLKKDQSFKGYVYKTSGTSYDLCTNLESSVIRNGRTLSGTTTYCISR